MNLRTNLTSAMALLLSGALLLGGCSGGDETGSAPSTDGEGDGEETEELAVPVEVAQASRSRVFAAYNGTTVLEADREADVVAKTTGVVLKPMVEEGDQVTAGQVLAELDRERLDLEVARAQATLARLENDYSTSRAMTEKSLISAEEFER